MTVTVAPTPWTDPETWRAVFGTQLRDCRVEPLTGGNSPSEIGRIHLAGTGLPASVIVKESRLPWSMTDSEGFRREGFAYRHLLIGAADVAPRLLHIDEDKQMVRLVLEDLAPAFEFRPRRHTWTPGEIATVAEIFARLHGGTQSASQIGSELLMPAPDRRWPPARIHEAAVTLDRWARDSGRAWGLAAAVEATMRRFPAASLAASPSCLVHSDFNTGNIALSRSPATGGRLLDWHIAAAGGPGFDLGNLFFQPWNNHRNIDPVYLLDAYDAARRHHGLQPWHDGDRAHAFTCARCWCALSYLPPIATQTDSGLSGWWLHTAEAVEATLTAAGAHQ